MNQETMNGTKDARIRELEQECRGWSDDWVRHAANYERIEAERDALRVEVERLSLLLAELRGHNGDDLPNGRPDVLG